MKTIILAGTGRSGTTIAADVINASARFRYLFEPMHPKEVPLFSDLRSREYLVSEKAYPEIEQLFDRLFDGEVGNSWTDRHPIPTDPQGLFIKLVRANLLLGWFHRRYPGMKLILMVRHPLSVTESRIRFKWPISLGTYTNQPVLSEHYLGPFEEVLAGCQTPYEQHVAAWCIETLVPIVELTGDASFPLVYEQLVEHPGVTLINLGNFLGETFGETELERLSRPSEVTMASSGSAIIQGKKVTRRWETGLSSQEIARGFEIVEGFGLGGLYGEKAKLPTANSFQEVRKTLLKKLGRSDGAVSNERYATPKILSRGMKRSSQVDEAVQLAKRGLHRAAKARLERMMKKPELAQIAREAKREVEAIHRADLAEQG